MSAEAPPHAIIINPETQQCTDYWSLDELPKGWIAYSPDYENSFYEINTSFGKCVFEDLSITNNPETLKECCESLGIEVVNYNDFNKDFLNILNQELFCSEYPNEEYEESLVIDKEANKCVLLSCHVGNAGFSKKYDKFEIYGIQQQYTTSTINTPFGECNYGPYNTLNECCNQLGLTYVTLGAEDIIDNGIFNRILAILIPFIVIIALIAFFVIIISIAVKRYEKSKKK